MICEILLGLILITNVVELIVITSIYIEDKPPELTDELRSKLYS